MQLDRTRIAVRERSYLETFDLALRVARVHALGLLPALAAGIVPCWAAAAWLLADYREYDFEWNFPFTHMFWMTVLILWVAPLATAPATLFLGQAVFTDEPHPRSIAGDMLRSIAQVVILQGLGRFFTWTLPYLNEVILLERNPLLRRRGSAQRTTLERARALHRGQRGDLAGRTLATFAAGAALTFALWISIAIVRGFLLSRLNWDRAMFTFYWPLAIWCVVAFFAVVRFLAYLDLRIRREGWEVELLMRAEEARLKGQPA